MSCTQTRCKIVGRLKTLFDLVAGLKGHQQKFDLYLANWGAKKAKKVANETAKHISSFLSLVMVR